MTWRTRRRAHAVMIGAAVALVGGWAQAGPGKCEVRIEAVHFTRASYPVGRWFSGLVEGAVYDGGQVLVPGRPGWGACFSGWQRARGDLLAIEPTTGQKLYIDLFEDAGDLVLAGELSPRQAGGRYVIPAHPRGMGLNVVNDVVIVVEDNPDADLDPPELVGFRVSTPVPAGHMPGSRWIFADESRLGHGDVVYRRLGADPSEASQDIWCEGARCDSWSSGLWHSMRPGRYVIDRLTISDALGNTGEITDHPLFDGVVIEVVEERGDYTWIVRGNLTGTPLPDSVLPPPVALDKVVTAPRPSGASLPDAPTERFILDRADAPSSHPDCRAAPSGAGHGGWALLLLLAACRRRNRR